VRLVAADLDLYRGPYLGERRPMRDEAITAAVEQFIKKVSFSTQREVERVIRTALANGKIRGDETLTTAVTVTNEKLGLNTTIYSKIVL
jgi:Family of unknown function (DUF6494)